MSKIDCVKVDPVKVDFDIKIWSSSKSRNLFQLESVNDEMNV